MVVLVAALAVAAPVAAAGGVASNGVDRAAAASGVAADGVEQSAVAGTAADPVPSSVPADEDNVTDERRRSYDTSVLWRGFRHAWSYNHRASRLGSWVEVRDCDDLDCSYAVGHGGASGAGADRASFRDAYTELSARGVGFDAGAVEFDVQGTEKKPGPASQVIEGTREVSVPANGTLADRDNYVALVNGFDLVADDVPMKPVRLEVEVSEPRVEDGDIRFEVRYRTLLDCDTPECPGLVGNRATDVDYTLRVNYLVAGGDRSTFSVATPGEVAEHYDWENCRNNPVRRTAWFEARDRHDRGIDRFPNSVFPGNHMNCEQSDDRELDHRDHRTNRTVDAEPGFGTSVPGIRGFSLRLDGEAHFTQYDTVVGGSYDRSGGAYDMRALTFFKEWSARPGQTEDAWGALGHEGAASVSVDPVVLQFREGCKRSFVHGGGIHFQTEHKDETPPTHPSASVESDHEFQYGTGWAYGYGESNGCVTGKDPSPTKRNAAFWVDVWDEQFRDQPPTEAAVEDPTRLRYQYNSRFYDDDDDE